MSVSLPVLPAEALRPDPQIQATHRAAATPAPNGPLADPLGRGVGYLRLSLTEACAMRCVYCRPSFLRNPRNEQRLSPAQLERLVRHLARHHGLHKVRLTGGDPTSRPELLEIIERIAAVPGIDDLAMTTNGLTLARQAEHYRRAGLKRVNVSLDTLDTQRFRAMTGVDGLDQVLAGIDAATDAGLTPIKLNTVVVRGQNLDDLPGLVGFAADRGITLRMIELMPMGPLAEGWDERYAPERMMRRALAGTVTRYTALRQGHDAARRYRVRLRDGRSATLGFITPMSCNFCADCNRLRVAADGTLYPCLMDRPTGSIADALQPGTTRRRIDSALRAALAHKAPEHPTTGFVTMTRIGG
ncbi:MAG: GTP 3',8-cyclase MoaA [Planctomycetota bacterium]